MDIDALSQQLNLSFQYLEGQLYAREAETFSLQFKELVSSSAAKSASKVIYVWFTDKPIPRLRGASNIVYVGETINGLSGRYRKSDIEKEASGYTWERHNHIFQFFGPTRVAYAAHENPRKAEKEAIRIYSHEHLEEPPFNMSS